MFFVEKMTEMDYPEEKKATKNWKLMNISIFFFQRKHFSKNTQLLRTMIYSRSKEVDTINRSSQPIINHSSQLTINLVQKSNFLLQKSKFQKSVKTIALLLLQIIQIRKDFG